MMPRLSHVVLFFLSLTSVSAATFVVAADQFTNDLAVFLQNATTGALTAVGIPVPSGGTGPSSVVWLPSLKEVLVANKGSNGLACFSFNTTTGGLTFGGSLNTGTQPIRVVIDLTQQHVYSVNFGSNNVSGFNVLPGCGFTPIAGSPFSVGAGPTAMAFDSTFHAFVTNSQSNNITELTEDPLGGSLTPFGSVATGRGPDDIVGEPTLHHFYVALATDGFVQSFTDGDGVLTQQGTGQTGTQPAAEIIANGTLYTADEGSSDIAANKIDPVTGALIPVPGSPFPTGGSGPIGLAADPLRGFLYTANFNTNNISEDAIGSTGALIPVPGSPVPTGGFDSISLVVVRADLQPPIITKQFGASTIAAGGTTTLTFTLTNSNQNAALTDISFEDMLAGFNVVIPSGLLCLGAGSLQAGSFVLIGAQLPPGGMCTFVLSLTAASASGLVTNTTTPVASNAPGDGSPATATITVGPQSPIHFSITTPLLATAAQGFPIIITPLNSSNQPVTTFSGSVNLTSGDPIVRFMPSGLTLPLGGVGSDTVTLFTTGSQTLTAMSNATTPPTTGSATITVVNPHLSVSAPGTATAGTLLNVTVTPLDGLNNTFTGFPDMVKITSNDPTAILPASPLSVNGQVTFPVTLNTQGSETITATDITNSSITSSATVNVTGSQNHFLLTGSAIATAGEPFQLTVSALNAMGQTVPNLGQPVFLSSSDLKATFIPQGLILGTGGVGTDTVTLFTTGTQTVSASAATSPQTTGSTTVNVVNPHLGLLVPATATAGVPFSVSVSALDATNNVISTFPDPVKLTSTDPTFGGLTVGAISNFLVTLSTLGPQTLTAADTTNPAITTTSSAINVIAGSGNGIIIPAAFTMQPGSFASLPISLASPMVNDIVVNLTSSAPSIVGLPPGNMALTAFTLPVGTIKKTVNVFGAVPGVSMITAAANGLPPATTTVTVSPFAISFTPNPLTVSPGSGANVALTLSSAPPTGLTVSLSSDNPGVVTVPSTVTFSAGSPLTFLHLISVAPGAAHIHVLPQANALGATADVTVLSQLAFTTATLPDATVSVPYSTTILAMGGVPPYSLTLIQGTLPLGLSLNGMTITGIPLAPIILDPLEFILKDSAIPANSAQGSFTLTVNQ